jgi:phospholipid N-methyltransferase
MNLTPTSELEAVNLMLSVIGESPVNTVEDNGVVDAVVARQILNQASREVQLIGWHWNTEEDYPLAAAFPSGEVALPTNTLRVDTTYPDESIDVVQRGNRLYDRKNHTYKIGKTVKVEIVLMLPFEELPEAARSYIAIRAARQFQERMVGSEVLHAFNSRDEMRAMAALQNAEAETADYNVLSDSWSVARVLDR